MLKASFLTLRPRPEAVRGTSGIDYDAGVQFCLDRCQFSQFFHVSHAESCQRTGIRELLCCELITVNATPLRLANPCVTAATPPSARVGQRILSLENAQWLWRESMRAGTGSA